MKTDTYDRVLAILEKSQVKPHTRKLKSGAVVQVKGYNDKRTKKHTSKTASHIDSPEMDEFNRRLFSAMDNNGIESALGSRSPVKRSLPKNIPSPTKYNDTRSLMSEYNDEIPSKISGGDLPTDQLPIRDALTNICGKTVSDRYSIPTLSAIRRACTTPLSWTRYKIISVEPEYPQDGELVFQRTSDGKKFRVHRDGGVMRLSSVKKGDVKKSPESSSVKPRQRDSFPAPDSGGPYKISVVRDSGGSLAHVFDESSDSAYAIASVRYKTKDELTKLKKKYGVTKHTTQR